MANLSVLTFSRTAHCQCGAVFYDVASAVDGFQGGLQIGGRMITNLRYADDIILLATSEAELQELVDRLDSVRCKYSLGPTHQCRQDQGNGERWYSVPHTHSE